MDVPEKKETAVQEKLGSILADYPWRVYVLLTLLVVCIALLMWSDGGMAPPPCQTSDIWIARLGEVERRVTELEAAAKTPTPVLETEKETLPDLQGLETALKALEEKVSESARAVDQARSATGMGVPAALAFVQMQIVALEGRPFEVELKTLEKAMGPQAPEGLLVKFASLAHDGAPPPSALLGAWRTMEPQVRSVLRSANAKTWQEKLLSELEGLVSIRPVAGGAGGIFAVLDEIETYLAQGYVAGAMEKADSLPSGAQDVLRTWRAKAQARIEMESALSSLAQTLIGGDPVAEKEGAGP